MSLFDDRSKPLTPAGIHAIAQGPDGWIAAGDGRCHAVLHKDGELRYHFDFSTENHRMRALVRLPGGDARAGALVMLPAKHDGRARYASARVPASDDEPLSLEPVPMVQQVVDGAR